MKKYKFLSGEEIVARGATKIEVTLPEIGLKEVSPNGSWLEQKQIQSALEARKHLVEVQRIEKSGALTHAIWRDDLKLAEITQQTGGYWQFLGHHRDGKLCLRPEETLFLMEVNSLLLRYNEVIVSLQQAYSLLLSDEISIIQYKVYASLSRIGYKVFRHLVKPNSDESDKISTNTIICGQENTIVESHGKSSDSVSENENLSKIDTNLSINSDVVETTASNTHEKEEDTDMSEPSESSAMVIEEASIDEVDRSNKAESNKSSEENEMIVEESNVTESVENTVNKVDSNVNNKNDMVVEENNLTEGNESNIKKNSKENNDSTTSNTFNECTSNTSMEIEAIDGGTGISVEIDSHKTISLKSAVARNTFRENVSEETSSNKTPPICLTKQSNTNIDPLTKYCKWKLEKLKKRQTKISPAVDIHKCFKDCPDISENQIITVHTPKEEYIPKNIFLNNLHYVLNVDNVRTRNAVSLSSANSTYSLSDEVNGAHVRRVTNTSMQPVHVNRSQNSGFPPFFPSFRPNIPFRQYNVWRPRPQNMSYFQFNLFFQRPFMSNFHPRFQFFPRMHIPMFPRHSSDTIDFSINNTFGNVPSNTRKRPKDHARVIHLENLRNLAQRLKNLNTAPNLRNQNVEAVQNLIHTYNMRFRTRLRLSAQYEIINDETIVDTITLDDDDEECRAKRPRTDSQPDLFMENLLKIRQTALKLKQLEAENKSTARHRRALSSVIKTFNKFFDADIYMTVNYDVIDRRYINLDSSSDSDCVVEEVPKVITGKKLRNPFNILKKLSEKQGSSSSPSTSRQEVIESPAVSNAQKDIEKYFKKTWLPKENDFGRPEITPRDTMTARFIETKKEEFLLDFLKDQPYKFNNWTEIKIAFLESIEETNAILHTGAMIENNVEIKSLVKPEDCTDRATVLRKLSIISSNSNIQKETSLKIDYDVYNRDVKNFRKGNRPKPHFRVICVEETSGWPLGVDLATLRASIKDDATLLFAVVGIGSISYVQLNSTDLPVYMPCNELG